MDGPGDMLPSASRRSHDEDTRIARCGQSNHFACTSYCGMFPDDLIETETGPHLVEKLTQSGVQVLRSCIGEILGDRIRGIALMKECNYPASTLLFGRGS